MSKVIVLDPGHGGNDSGALNGSRYEKNDNLRMAKAIKALLQKQGHTVLMTREDDTNPTYQARLAVATRAKADLFLSVHRNSFTSSGPNGIEIYARYQPHLAAMATILEELAKEPHQANRGAKLGAYKVLYGATMPAGLIEIGFISNTEDNRLFDANFDQYAEAVARGIVKAVGAEWKDQSEPSKDTVLAVEFDALSKLYDDLLDDHKRLKTDYDTLSGLHSAAVDELATIKKELAELAAKWK